MDIQGVNSSCLVIDLVFLLFFLRVPLRVFTNISPVTIYAWTLFCPSLHWRSSGLPYHMSWTDVVFLAFCTSFIYSISQISLSFHPYFLNYVSDVDLLPQFFICSLSKKLFYIFFNVFTVWFHFHWQPLV